MKPNKYKINTQTNSITQYIIITYISSTTSQQFRKLDGEYCSVNVKTIFKTSKFSNSTISPYTDVLFTIANILQIFWYIPMITRLGVKWYYIGLIGAIGLPKLLLMTKIPNGITNLLLENKNSTRLLTLIIQFLSIEVTIIIKNLLNSIKFSKIEMH